MDVDDVWNGFFLYSLLLDHAEHKSILELDHNASSQMQRLRPALQARTCQMRGTGQEEWNHACELCSWVYTDEDNTKRGSDNVQLLNVTQIFL
jgi:hypothetical protein